MTLPAGLRYLPAYIDEASEAALLAAVDASPWLDDLARRVQHHGYRYDYKARSVPADLYLGPLPAWVAPLVDRLVDEGLFERRPDQLIVNEYLPGQGIARHVDCVPCFGPVIASLSLGSGCEMEFEDPRADALHRLRLDPRSLLVLAGEARYRWTHAIKKRQSDPVGDGRVPRGRRVSLTFRTVLLGA